MLKVHKDIIFSNFSDLVERTDLDSLVPELLRRDVFNKQMISRILDSSNNQKLQKTDLYLEILKRGPQAFAKLQDALIASKHLYLANKLKIMDSEQISQRQRRDSLNSIGSELNNSYNGSESDGPCLSSQKNTSDQKAKAKRPNTFPDNFSPTTSGVRRPENSESSLSKTFDVSDFQKNLHDPHGKVFAAPTYGVDTLDEELRKLGLLLPCDRLADYLQEGRPVVVKCSVDWQVEEVGKPLQYKMNSNPRGLALVVNNWKFSDSITYPDRIGSENDVNRLIKLLYQLHFKVEFYENKTKYEMEVIVRNFSERDELNEVDCAWVTFMSHGEEGEIYGDSEIIGVDGLGYKTEEIISRFHSNSCKMLIFKPKIFFFQACRGSLFDPGSEVDNLNMNLSHRTLTDGRKVHPPEKLKVRTQSDIFVAYPNPIGYAANRDVIVGAWFIQAVIDIFSAHAHNTHLEDLLKLVDNKIKKMNNLLTSNFQTVTTKTVGWNKHLYFNPGLCKDKTTGATIRICNHNLSPELDEGMDVVDVSSSNSDKSPNTESYSRFKNEETDEDSDGGKDYGCFHSMGCKTS